MIDTYHRRLQEITPRVLNALALAQKKARLITDEDRQKGCTELDWTLDVIHNAFAMDDLDTAIDSYCKNKIDDQQLGKVVNEYIDHHRIRWIRGIAFRFIR